MPLASDVAYLPSPDATAAGKVSSDAAGVMPALEGAALLGWCAGAGEAAPALGALVGDEGVGAVCEAASVLLGSTADGAGGMMSP